MANAILEKMQSDRRLEEGSDSENDNFTKIDMKQSTSISRDTIIEKMLESSNNHCTFNTYEHGRAETEPTNRPIRSSRHSRTKSTKSVKRHQKTFKDEILESELTKLRE